MTEKKTIKVQLLDVTPALRAFAISLTRNREAANDLLQETLIKAWAHQHTFTPGTNFRAWTFTIMRNEFLSNYRKAKREVREADHPHAFEVAQKPAQVESISCFELRQDLKKLGPKQREAIVLVGASGFSYEEAADICGVPIGTIKSRANRARVQLKELLPDIQSYESQPGLGNMTSSATSV